MQIANNVFVRLLKWSRGQEENYLTESLTFLIEYLKTNEPQIACEIIDFVTNGFLKLKASDAQACKLLTQLVVDEGRPDLVLLTHDTVAFIEVKKEADVRQEQLLGYERQLKTYNKHRTALMIRAPGLQAHTNILLSSDYVNSQVSGEACVQIEELTTLLSRCLGGRNACEFCGCMPHN